LLREVLENGLRVLNEWLREKEPKDVSSAAKNLLHYVLAGLPILHVAERIHGEEEAYKTIRELHEELRRGLFGAEKSYFDASVKELIKVEFALRKATDLVDRMSKAREG